MDPLVRLSAATSAWAEAKSLDEVKRIVDIAEAARTYARAAKMGLAAQNHAAEIKLRAERKAGEMLREMEKSDGGRPTENRLQPATGFDAPTYKELGVEKTQAHRWQTVASLPAEEFEKHIAEVVSQGEELTTSSALRLAQELKRAIRAGETRSPDAPSGKYRVIYADPPWRYNDSGVITDSDSYGRAERHYPTMSIEELCSLNVRDLAEDDAVLFLWTTAPLLLDSFSIVAAWGFKYKTFFVWDKVRHNFGHYSSVRHEVLLVCTRGSCTPDNLKLFDSVQTIERTEQHSEKPEEFREIIDTLYTYGSRIELFARRQVEGWDVWGNQC